MKKTFTKKTLVAGIAAALMTLNEDGKTLTPKWKYEYQYDTLGTMTEKKLTDGMQNK